MISVRVHRRHDPPGWGSWLIAVAAVACSLGIGGLFLTVQGKPGLEGMTLLVNSGFFSSYALEDCLIKAVPIYLCSLGVAVAFRLQVWNIGAEGQYAMGAVGATWAALTFPHLPWMAALPLMLLSATIAGGLWGLVPALLKIRLNTNETIVTLMLNYIAILFLEYMVYGPWKDPTSFGFPMTRAFSPGSIVGTVGGTRVNWGVALCAAAGLAYWVLFRYTRLGFELAASGENPRAARYARLPYGGLVVFVLVAGGALSGWAGFIETSANLNRLQTNVLAGYGYTAIVVAWLARLNPFYIAVGSYLLAGLHEGMEALQLDMQVPAPFGQILEGLILLTVLAGSLFSGYRLELRRRP